MLALLLTPDALACSLALGEEHQVVANPDDTTAPTGPSDIQVDTRRGVGPTCVLGSCSSTSCDDIGWIELNFLPATDDASDPSAIGYQLRVVDGTLPDGLTVDETRRVDLAQGDRSILTLVWIDDATDEQEPFDFTLGIAPVDEAGNVGEEQTIELSDEGNVVTKTCSTVHPGSALAMVAALGLAARRSRRR